jgi:hypothetical protein
MEKEAYKPSRKEVLTEVVRPVRETGKKVGKYFGDSLIEMLAVYMTPTAIRKFSNINTGLGMALNAAQLLTYVSLAKKGIPAYLIPLATNVASGIYETGKFVYKKAEQRLIGKRKSLEGKLE